MPATQAPRLSRKWRFAARFSRSVSEAKSSECEKRASAAVGLSDATSHLHSLVKAYFRSGALSKNISIVGRFESAISQGYRDWR